MEDERPASEQLADQTRRRRAERSPTRVSEAVARLVELGVEAERERDVGLGVVELAHVAYGAGVPGSTAAAAPMGWGTGFFGRRIVGQTPFDQLICFAPRGCGVE
jgi:hypothetical protein